MIVEYSLFPERFLEFSVIRIRTNVEKIVEFTDWIDESLVWLVTDHKMPEHKNIRFFDHDGEVGFEDGRKTR